MVTEMRFRFFLHQRGFELNLKRINQIVFKKKLFTHNDVRRPISIAQVIYRTIERNMKNNDINVFQLAIYV